MYASHAEVCPPYPSLENLTDISLKSFETLENVAEQSRV